MNRTVVMRLAAGLSLCGGFVAAAWRPAGRDAVMGGYSTSLAARTNAQRANALRAAERLNGVRIAPGAVFSFNRAVGPWSSDRGYILAPVSYEGEMLLDWGGGVCQTSTTLYNAALLAGLDVVERTRHTWAPHYCPAGRDAAVAQYDIDLRLRNPYPFPVRIECRRTGDRLQFEIRGALRGPMAAVTTETVAGEASPEVVRVAPRYAPYSPRVLNRGKAGARAVVNRVYLQGNRRGQREMVSRDWYPPMSRLIAAPR